MGVKRHTDLVAWQRAMDLVTACHPVGEKLRAAKAFWLQDQLLRAATSVPANIAEGQGTYMAGRFRHHLAIASGSLREVETHLESAVRLKLLSTDEIAPALAVADHTGRLLWGLRESMKPSTGRPPRPVPDH